MAYVEFKMWYLVFDILIFGMWYVVRDMSYVVLWETMFVGAFQFK